MVEQHQNLATYHIRSGLVTKSCDTISNPWCIESKSALRVMRVTLMIAPSVWVLTILTSEACHHSEPHTHTSSSIHLYTDTDHGVTMGFLSPLPSGPMCPVIASPSPRPTRSDIRLWSGQFSLVSPLLCSVELTVITPTKNSVFSIFPASDIAACWGDWRHDDPMELGWIVNNASNLFLSKEINP